ncbi:MAG: hypothetical protein ACFFAT_15320 [Promethearchaeota archaeon]
MFKLLCLGDPEITIQYVSSALEEMGDSKETHIEWFTEFNVLDNVCDLEIDIITDLISAEFDEIIPSVDGIIYFLNPINEEELTFFKIILPIIMSVKRDIPTIILFYDSGGIIPHSTNRLLEDIWVNYPNLEAFINLAPNQFHQVLQCICLAMINGDTPLNIENAWMRFPIFIQLANFYFENKNYYYAAQAIKNLANIAEIYEKQEYFVYSEQAAFLFSRLGLFLEASKVIEKVDPKLSYLFKKSYAETMIVEGNQLFNKNKYENAAIQYESAGQWASIELGDKEIIKTSFELAINSWISACKCEKGFLILERLPHENIKTILTSLSDKIIAASDFLISIGNLSAAKDQLYYSVFTYQKESLFEDLKKIVLKLLEVLSKIFDISIQKKEIYEAKFTYDEIENIWETFNIEKTNLDSNLEILIKLFVDKMNLSMASALINKLNSLELKKKLTKYSSKIEEKTKKIEKQEKEDIIKRGIEILQEFIKAEHDIIAKINIQTLTEANGFIVQNDWLKAATHIKLQADFLREIGKEDIENQILTKSLDILLDGELFDNFFKYFKNLDENMKKSYLTQVFPVYIEKLKTIKEKQEPESPFKIFENSILIFRNQELYEESKEIVSLYIEVLKKESMNIIREEENEYGIEKATDLIKKILDISSAYLDNITINFDEIYKAISEIYLYKIDDLSSALAYNDKIENKEIKIEIHKKIAKIEAKKSASIMKAARKSTREAMLEERFSIIEQKAEDALRDQENELKQRIGFKRAYFNEPLIYLKIRKFDDAIDLYLESMINLINIKKYYLSSVSFALACLLLIIKGNFDKINRILEEREASSSSKLFFETFPVILIQFLVEIYNFNDKSKFPKALALMKNLPLFEEEKMILDEFVKEEFEGEDMKREEGMIKKSKGKSEKPQDIMEKVELEQIFSKLQQKMVDTRIDSDKILKKRKAMRRRYYDNIINSLETNSFNEAAEEYYNLANNAAKRKDFNTSALSILLYGLSLLKSKRSIIEIEKDIEKYLDTLGLNKTLVRDTFEISLILSIIRVKKKEIFDYDYKIKEMLSILPLFEEEKKLIVNF